MPGTAPSTSSPATGSIWRRPIATTSGDHEGAGACTCPHCLSLEWGEVQAPGPASRKDSDMRNRKLLLAASLLLAGAAPMFVAAAQPARSAPATKGRPQYGSWGVDLTARDLSVKPGDDFWAYANQSFVRANPIPADRTSYGVGDVLDQQIQAQLRDIVEHAPNDAAGRQVSTLYASWMDEAGTEARGPAPLRPWLDRIDAVRDKAGLIRLFAAPGFASPLGLQILPDPADTSRYIAAGGQSGLGLPGRGYYVGEGADFDRIRTAYRAYLIQLQRLAGLADPEARADRVIALERSIAEVQWAPERSRDIQQVYNPKTRAQLQELAPQMDWNLFLNESGLGSVQTIIAGETTAITAEAAMLDSVPLDTWKDWL